MSELNVINPLIFKAHQRLVFIGDSITDANRTGADAPFGNGYVSMVRAFLIARYPELNLTVINKGVGGNTVRHLAQRWERDVIAERPHWLAVMIGINDVWRHFTSTPGEAVPIDEYQRVLRGLLQRAREATRANLILLTPYMIEPTKSNPMRQLMDVYGRVVDLIGREFGAVMVRTQDAWDRVLASTPPTFWSQDKIHPTPAGHAVIANALLNAVNFRL
ncbi:MAG: SGNH/GDSL hydrolase family protein [Anaerolineales bacterium]|nr:SGNH/GDSL hydrolase family protein [Anaerolineales bacterium]